MTIRSVEAMRTNLLEVFAQHAAIEIDCSAATEVDLSAVQLLVSALKSARRSGKAVSIMQPTSGALRRTLSRAGLTEAFESLCEGGDAIAAVGVSG
jgi:anti-anti-sigma regulatory factor